MRWVLPRAGDDRIRRTIGLSLKATFQNLTGQRRSEDVDVFVSRYVERADQVMADLTVVYDSVTDTTVRLIETGFELGIVSTKFRYRIENILEKEGLSDRFSVIVGGEDVTEHKPHPEGLLTAMSSLRMKTGNVYYVGDSMVDALTAERAGVPFIAVLTGTTGESEFNELPNIAVHRRCFEFAPSVRCPVENRTQNAPIIRLSITNVNTIPPATPPSTTRRIPYILRCNA